MKLKDLLTKYPEADLEVHAYTDLYDGSVNYNIPKDDLIIPDWAWPECQNILVVDYAMDIDLVVRNYVTPEAIGALDFEFDEYQFGHGAYFMLILTVRRNSLKTVSLSLSTLSSLLSFRKNGKNVPNLDLAHSFSLTYFYR